jgi:hypothetical protein
LTAAIGAIVGAATGYAVYAASSLPYSDGIIVWSDAHLDAMDTILWAVLGVGVATELRDSNDR